MQDVRRHCVTVKDYGRCAIIPNYGIMDIHSLNF